VLSPSVEGPVNPGYLPLLTLVAGGFAGGVLLGGGVAAIGLAALVVPPARTAVIWGVGGVGALALFSDRLRLWLPQRPCQVAESTPLMQSPGATGFNWGFELGTGIRTYFVKPAMYSMLALAFAADPLIAIAACATYGTSRAGMMTLMAILEGRLGRRDGEDHIAMGKGLERFMRAPLFALFASVALVISIQWLGTKG